MLEAHPLLFRSLPMRVWYIMQTGYHAFGDSPWWGIREKDMDAISLDAAIKERVVMGSAIQEAEGLMPDFAFVKATKGRFFWPRHLTCNKRLIYVAGHS